MPLAWGGDYYLVGTFNNWTKGDAYKFSDNGTGTYILPNNADINIPLPDDGKARFKIINDNGPSAEWTWYGSTGECNIHHAHHEDVPTMAGGNDNDFILQSSGLTGFSFTLDNGKPELTVTREPKLSLRGNWNDWDNWNEEPMTQTSTGWTISKTNSQWRQFGFVDEFGQWRGGPRDTGDFYGIDGNNLGNYFDLWTNGKQFKINTDQISDIIINVTSDLSQTVIDNNTVDTKSLADIESSGVVGKTYIVNEPLQVVYFNSDKHLAFARDLTGTTVTCPEGKVDYITAVAKDHTGDWIQYNWVMLDFSGVSQVPSGLLKGNIQGVKGTYTDGNNYTIVVDGSVELTVTAGTEFTPNVYCPANFYSSDTQSGSQVVNGAPTETTVNYWLMAPKPMEVFTLSGALYYTGGGFAEGFYMEKKMQDATTGKWFNPAGLKGGISLNKGYNSTSTPSLTVGQSYRFLSVAKKKASKSEPSYGAPLRASNYSLEPEPGSNPNNTNFEASALDLTGAEGQIVTAVNDVKTGSDVVSVTYCDLAGRVSQKPFAGVNIIVTRYSDGTVKTTKAIK